MLHDAGLEEIVFALCGVAKLVREKFSNEYITMDPALGKEVYWLGFFWVLREL